MKHAITLLIGLVLLLPLSILGQTIEDTYQFKMALQVPRIYDNTLSLGYRKYQRQQLSGELTLTYKEDGTTTASVQNLVNNTHKVNGAKITYACMPEFEDSDYALVVAMGNNSTFKFNVGAVKFSFVAYPSYALGDANEDNSLYLDLAGNGSVKTYKAYGSAIPSYFKGNVTGQIGCGCTDYGHKSPTRLYKGYTTSTPIDIAPLYGTWYAKFKKRIIRSEASNE